MARRWQISTSHCSIAWACMWIHSATAMARSTTSSFRCRYRRRLMDWRRIAGLSLLIFGLAAASVAAEKPSLADAAEQRDRTLIRTLLDSGADVNAAQADGTTALPWTV